MSVDKYFEKMLDEKFRGVYNQVDSVEGKIDGLIIQSTEMKKSIESLATQAKTNAGNIRILKVALIVVAGALAAHTGEQLVIPVQHFIKFIELAI